MENDQEWHISCRDVAGRRRGLSVFANDDNVIVVAPPGETAVLGPLEAGRLRAAIRDAIVSTAAAQT